MATSEIQTPSGRDRVADVLVVVNFILRGLYTWVMPADLGVDYGCEMGSFNGPGRGNHRSYSSAEEILAELGITAESLGMSEAEAELEWPPELCADYARALWLEAGAVLRARGTPPAGPPAKPPRPLWADRCSEDGHIVLTIPDELIPFVGTDTMKLAANEVTYMIGAMHAYDRGKVSAEVVRAEFDIRMALWRERKRFADLFGRTE